jgi:hypothetical protein
VKKIILAFILVFPYQVNAEGGLLTQGTNKVNTDMGLFGIGPAYYMIRYNEEILPEYYETTGEMNATVAASGSQYTTAVGLELHYNYSFAGDLLPIDVRASHGFSASPFLGLYDFDDGIDGIIVGAMFGYWRGEGNYKFKPSLNLGIGYTVHMDQLVLADGVAEGDAILPGDNYIERKDVGGWALTFSAAINF